MMSLNCFIFDVAIIRILHNSIRAYYTLVDVEWVGGGLFEQNKKGFGNIWRLVLPSSVYSTIILGPTALCRCRVNRWLYEI